MVLGTEMIGKFQSGQNGDGPGMVDMSSPLVGRPTATSAKKVISHVQHPIMKN